jgi:hypothetical protein
MIVPLLLFGFGAVRRRITIQNASLAILGLLLGTMPLILFNIRHKNETLGANTHLSLIDVPRYESNISGSRWWNQKREYATRSGCCSAEMNSTSSTSNPGRGSM